MFLKTLAKLLVLACLAFSETSVGAEWTVWNVPRGWNVWSGYGPPYPPPVEGLRLPEHPRFDRAYLPRLTEQTGRLRYIGEMYVRVEECISAGETGLNAADLANLDDLWQQNLVGLPPEELWQVHYGLMHQRYGGGTAISNASCSLAQAWLKNDLLHLANH